VAGFLGLRQEIPFESPRDKDLRPRFVVQFAPRGWSFWCRGGNLRYEAQREFPSPLRCDSDGKPRLIATSITFCGVVDAAFNQIRQVARTSASVTIRLLETIRMVGSVSTRLQDRETLRRHADMVVRSGRESLVERDDREVVDDRYKAACLQLDSGPTPKILPPEATP
jgi:uncharacterized membrane protein